MTREEEMIARHERELRELHREQNDCNHKWGEVKYDPEVINEPKYETRFQGSDCFPELIGHSVKKVDRWSRTCKKCGKVEYTKEQKPIAFEPKF